MYAISSLYLVTLFLLGDGFVTQQEYDNYNKRREEEEAESRRQQEKYFRELITVGVIRQLNWCHAFNPCGSGIQQ
jgi:hypothetical protein